MSPWLADASLTHSRTYAIAMIAIATVLMLQLATTVTGAVLARQQFAEVSTDTFGYVGELTAERVSRFAEAGAGVTEEVANAIELLGPRVSHNDLELLLLQRLAIEKQLRAIQVGWPDGAFMVLGRDQDGYRTQRGDGGSEGQVTTRFYDAERVLDRQEVADVDYDPRTRPWYLSGATAPAIRWTQPYLDFFDGSTVVSVAHAARDSEGLTAVVGADLNLTELEEVLDSIPYGDGAQAFVLTQRLEIIAAPSSHRGEIAAIIASTGDVARAADIGLSVDPAVIVPSGARFTRESGRVVLDRGFPVEEGLPWRLHIRASDDELSAGLGNLADTGLWISGVSFVVVLIAGAVLWRVRHPIDKMRQRAMTDPLTGLLNRREFFRRGQLVSQRAAERGDIVMVTALDLDEFKGLNDNLGHGVGDRALTAVAAGMTGSARAGDLVARAGGDEFVMLHVLREGDQPHNVAQRVRDRVEHEIHTRVAGSEHVGVTAGYAMFGAGAGDLEVLVDQADQALVAGKRTRKGRVYSFEESGAAIDRREDGPEWRV